MVASLISLLTRERRAGLPNFAGTHLDVEVPITQRFIDMVVARVVGAKRLHGAAVTLGDANTISVEVSQPVFGFPARLALDMRLGERVDLAADPRIYLLVGERSFTWTAVSRIARAAGLAPAGVEIARDGLAIDLRTLAARAGVGDLLPLARRLTFQSEQGVLRIGMGLEIPEGGIGTRSAASTNDAEETPDVHPRADQRLAQDEKVEGPSRKQALLAGLPLETELRGARASGQIAATDGLVNDMLRLLHATLGERPYAAAPHREAVQPGSDRMVDSKAGWPDAATVARWVERGVVHFEQGRAVLECDIVVR
jgi:hypothetical protein